MPASIAENSRLFAVIRKASGPNVINVMVKKIKYSSGIVIRLCDDISAVHCNMKGKAPPIDESTKNRRGIFRMLPSQNLKKFPLLIQLPL